MMAVSQELANALGRSDAGWRWSAEAHSKLVPQVIAPNGSTLAFTPFTGVPWDTLSQRRSDTRSLKDTATAMLGAAWRLCARAVVLRDLLSPEYRGARPGAGKPGTPVLRLSSALHWPPHLFVRDTVGQQSEVGALEVHRAGLITQIGDRFRVTSDAWKAQALLAGFSVDAPLNDDALWNLRQHFICTHNAYELQLRATVPLDYPAVELAVLAGHTPFEARPMSAFSLAELT